LTAAVMLAFGTVTVAQESAKTAPPKSLPVTAPSPTAADAKPGQAPSAAAVDPTSLTTTDVHNWKGLARRLEVMGEADLLPTSVVWKSFSPETKAATKRLSQGGAPAVADQRLVLDGINAWISSKRDATLTPENTRDPEIQALLKKSDLTAGDLRRLHRLIVDSMFPFEISSSSFMVADGGNTSRYPPNHLQEVTLSLSVPNLRGRLRVFLPNQETLVFAGEDKVTLKAPNDGKLRFAISGDEYEEPFPRTITWTDDDVKNGVVERTLPLVKGRRRP